jgi:hypothetical protein
MELRSILLTKIVSILSNYHFGMTEMYRKVAGTRRLARPPIVFAAGAAPYRVG